MIFFEQFNVSLKIFYLIGLKPATIGGTKMGKLMDLIAVCTTPSLCVTMTIYLLLFPHFPSYGLIFVIIYYGSLIPSLLMILAANGQCYFNKNAYQVIINQIRKMEKTLKEPSLRLSFKCIAVRYNLKFVIMYTLYFSSQILVFIEVWFIDSQNVLSSIFISLLRATYPIQLLHFVLYIDIAAMFFGQLNEEILDSLNFVHASGRIELLKHVKLVHLELWKLVVGVNDFFGSNLLFTTIFWFIDITHEIYWIFLNAHATLNLLGLLEGLISLSFAMASLLVLVNACESCLLEVKHLIENIEQYTFWTNNDVHLHQIKHEILNQINHLSISISACGFFSIDRKFLAGLVASCCMYIVIFIQFHQSIEK